MAADATVVFNERAMHDLFESEEGPVGKYLVRLAIQIERLAKHYAPVLTGLLRSSITWRLARDVIGLFAIIGTAVFYAIYQEFGTRLMAAHPFLRPALQDVVGR